MADPVLRRQTPLVDALSIPEILSRILYFVPLWVGRTHHYLTFKQYEFHPRHLLACSEVSRLWREHTLTRLWFVYNCDQLRQVPASPILQNAHRIRIFEDTYRISSSTFKDRLSHLVQLRILNSISLEQMNQILERSPRLKTLEWSKLTLMKGGGNGGWNLQDTMIPMVIWIKLARLVSLDKLTLERWELPWEELMLLLRSNPGLRELQLTSMRRDLNRITVASPNGQQKGEDERESAQDQIPGQQALARRMKLQAEDNSFLNVTDLTLVVARSFNDTLIDLLALCPRLQRLHLVIECRFDVFTVIGHLQRFQKQYGSSPTSPSQLSWSLNTIVITVQSSLSDDYFPCLTDHSLIALVRSAQPTGLTNFRGDIPELTKEFAETLISPSLTEFRGSDAHNLTKSFAEALIYPLRPLASPIHSNLVDLDLRITHTVQDVASLVHAILGFCTRLKKLSVDLMGEYITRADAEVMFCGLDGRAIADPNASWSCKGLEFFKWMGIQAPPEIDFVELLAYRMAMQEDGQEIHFDAMEASEDRKEQLMSGDTWNGGQTHGDGKQDRVVVGRGREADPYDAEDEEEYDAEDEEEYDAEDYDDAWSDSIFNSAIEESLSTFAVQVVAQARHLPELKQIYLNDIDYIKEIRQLGGVCSQNDSKIHLWPCGYRHKPYRQPRQQHEE